MSHFSVLVVTEDGDHDDALMPFCEEAEPFSDYAQRVDCTSDVEDDIRSEGGNTLDPDLFARKANEHGFDVDGGRAYSWEPINPKWDWHMLGGRWSAMLTFKSPLFKATGSNIEAIGVKYGEDRGNFGAKDESPYPAGKCDACIKSNLDVARMQEEAVARATEHWTKIDAVLRGYPNVLLAIEVMDVRSLDRNMTDEERKRYWAQPGIRELNDLVGLFGSVDDAITSYRAGIEEAKRRAKRWFLGAHSFLALDGVWHERGKMGWFGQSDDSMTQDEWSEAFMQLFDQIPHDAWISMVDCHT